MIYFDNASTTPLNPVVREAINSFYADYTGNPSSLCDSGLKLKDILTKSRENIANIMNAEPEEIFFTGSGSESNTWAIKGYGNLLKKSGRIHIISTPIEHHSLLNTLKDMTYNGFEVSFLDVDKDGKVSKEQLEDMITEHTGLVSVMAVNNEIGTIQPVFPLGEVCARDGIIFHTDAVQALGHTYFDVRGMNVSMASFSGHKFNAPCGIGGLYVRKDIQPISPLIHGGQQEFGVRGGTENVCMAFAMSLALSIASKESVANYMNIEKIKLYLYNELIKIPGVRIHGDPMSNVGIGILNISIEGVNAQSLLLALDVVETCVSAGSACASYDPAPSHVLKAIGLTDEEALSSIRISIGYQNTEEEAELFINNLKTSINILK